MTFVSPTLTQPSAAACEDKLAELVRRSFGAELALAAMPGGASTRRYFRLTLPAGKTELIARAWDSAAAVQPESPVTVWNPRGYANNSWARLHVTSHP